MSKQYAVINKQIARDFLWMSSHLHMDISEFIDMDVYKSQWSDKGKKALIPAIAFG